ncbi:MAG: hypothetical protein ABGX69_04860 [Methylococcales bacterium]|jgi:hypothetical protein
MSHLKKNKLTHKSSAMTQRQLILGSIDGVIVMIMTVTSASWF